MLDLAVIFQINIKRPDNKSKNRQNRLKNQT